MIVYLLILHYIADFLLQSRDMGKNKSSDPFVLTHHLIIQFAVFVLGLAPIIQWEYAVVFSVLNAAVHGVIDWNIWNLYKMSVMLRLKRNKELLGGADHWQYWEDHWFYSTIGLDQLLHTSTIILLAGWLL